MKVSYTYVKGRISSHCITFVQRKRRYRRYFKSRIEAIKFQNEKRLEFGIKDPAVMENDVIFHVLSEIKQQLEAISHRTSALEHSARKQEEILASMRKPPKPRILKVAEAAKILRVSPRKVYYLLEKKVFSRYHLPHTSTTFIRVVEIEKVLNDTGVEEALLESKDR
jgi:hypothetical protein